MTDASITQGTVARPELIPGAVGIGELMEEDTVSDHIQWMRQKVALNQATTHFYRAVERGSGCRNSDRPPLSTPSQDICLLGGYGPLRRWVALRYCQVEKREVRRQTDPTTLGQKLSTSDIFLFPCRSNILRSPATPRKVI